MATISVGACAGGDDDDVLITMNLSRKLPRLSVGNENEAEYVQLTSITLTAWSNYLCSNAQIEEEEAIKNLNPHIHTMGTSSFVGD